MVRRSLQASEEGIKKAKRAFLRKGWTQEYLAAEVGLETRQPIWKFFSGKPVDKGVFGEICFQLDLQPEEIALQLQVEEPTPEETVQNTASDIDALVTKVRSARHDKIQDQCGTLHLLDIARPVGLDDLYVEVNILEEITSQRWLEISDLQGFKPEEFDRLGLGKVRQEQVSGLKAVERYAKLMVLGKPGAGKTTFLQYLAVQCNQGQFQSTSVPLFIRLKNFAEDALDEGNFSLFNHISQELSRHDVSEPDVETLLNNGRFLLLLDGLDEVPEAVSDQVIKQIRKLAEKYYKNQLIVTCRIAAQEYRFQGFTEVEIADFKLPQIESFAKKWFVAVARNSPESGLKKAARFLEQMALPEHQPIRELAATPVLLNLTCLVFQAKADFPVKRSDLYKQGLDLLLIRWDESRGIKRDDIYRNLSLPRKLQLLSQLAVITFERGDYFFEESRLQQLITDYLRELPSAQIDPVALEQDSIAVVKSIEMQHGLLVERARRIYSFSHLTFQEYFTARAIVAGVHLSLPQLAPHLTENRWREVFLLTAQILPNADELLQLMKQQVDALVLADETLKPFLVWIDEKSREVSTPYKIAAVRAFYFAIALPPNHKLAHDQSLALAIERNLSADLGSDLALDLALAHALGVALALTPELIDERLSALHLALDLNHLAGFEAISESLTPLKNQLPNPGEDQKSLKQWWQSQGQAWTSQLRTAMIQCRNIGHEWHLSEASQQLLEQYANASQLLVECFNSNCQLTPTVWQKIEERLLLSD